MAGVACGDLEQKGASLPVSFRILPRLGVVYIRYEGLAGMQEGIDAFSAYMRHPDCRPGQRQLVDLSPVTELERDFAGLMKFQAIKADQFQRAGPTTLVAYVAPHAPARKLADFAARAWAGQSHVQPRVFEEEAGALGFLGLAGRSIAEILAGAQ